MDPTRIRADVRHAPECDIRRGVADHIRWL